MYWMELGIRVYFETLGRSCLSITNKANRTLKGLEYEEI